jgi:hypothetical protein
MKRILGITMALAIIICGAVLTVSASATPATPATRSAPMLGWNKWDAQEVTAFNNLITLYNKIQKEITGPTSVTESDFRAMSGDAVIDASIADSPDPLLNTEIVNDARSWNSLGWDGFLYVSAIDSGGSTTGYSQAFKAAISGVTQWNASVKATMQKDGV